MRSDEVTVLVTRFIVKEFPTARQRNIGVDDPLLEGGVIDSLGVLKLVGFLEQEFEIPVNDDDLVPENFRTIRDLAAFIHSRTASNGGPDA